jgi:2,3-diphosphopglycerate-independent phosphoglycerate mutase
MLIFLTGTLRVANTDFLFWLFRPGVVSIIARDVAGTSRSGRLALLQQSESAWDALRGVPLQPSGDAKAPWPWHCVCTFSENALGSAADDDDDDAPTSSVIGDVIAIHDADGSAVVEGLKRFFGVADGHHRMISDVTVSGQHADCVCFVAAGELDAFVRASPAWVRVPRGCYSACSTCPALPLHRQLGLAPLTRPPRTIMMILDGAGDSHAARNSRVNTPLEVATTTTTTTKMTGGEGDAEDHDDLSVVTRNGYSGLLDPYEPGVACGSDTAHLNIFGFPPSLWYRGRGAFESLGAGMAMLPGYDIAFKSNFAVLDEASGVVVARKCDKNFTAEGPVLCAVLDALPPVVVDGVAYRVSVKYAKEHRCGVVISGPGLTDQVSGTDPIADGKKLLRCAPAEPSSAATAERTCRVVEAVSMAFRDALREHPINVARRAAGKPPANVVLLRGAAQTAANPSFGAVHGLKAFAIAPTPIISGVSQSVGMDVVDAKAAGATGYVDSNLMGKADVAKRVLGLGAQQRQSEGTEEPYDFALVHVKGCDTAAHDGLADVKADVLARAGAALKALWDAAPAGTVFAVLADHSTPCIEADHDPNPVPASFAVKPARGDGGGGDAARKYTEAHVARCGALGRFRGQDVMRILRNTALSQLG